MNEMLAFATFMPQNEKAVKKAGQQYGTTADKQCIMGHLK